MWRLLFALVLASCDDPPVDQLIIEVIDGTGGRLSIPRELDAFEVRVASVYGGIDGGSQLVRFRRTYALVPSDSGADVPRGAVTLPQTLAIVPAGDGSGTVRVDVYGLKNGRVLQRLFRTSSFGVGLVRLPPFALTPLCFGVVCPDGESCESDGVCRPAMTRPDGGVVDAGACGPTQVQCDDRCIPYDDLNCGGCGVACPAGERCISNVCACAAGTARCGTTCVSLETDPANCGSCGMLCPTADTCAGGVCGCVAGGGTICGTECHDLQNDPANCGGCATMCALDHAVEGCMLASCTVASCEPSFADCNAMARDGCETSLDDTSSCGSCGNACLLPHAREACSAGRCVVASCDPSWGDCDGSDANGCENPLDSVSDCGSCRARCTRPFATTACGGGMCTVDSCDMGRENCDGNDTNGCEVDLASDESHCGMCGRRCTEFEVCMGGTCTCTGMVVMGRCEPSCGQLLAARGAPRGGTSCCPFGCATALVGAVGETHDCIYCCEAAVGVNGCL